MRVMIVDDEDLARAVIREYLGAYPGAEIVAECANGFDAVQAIAERRPDLVFLDIQMPKLNGFEVLELLEERPRIIFVTAYDTYAVKAFDVNAVDYLLKPFSRERFDAAMQRAGESGPGEAIDRLVQDARREGAPLERILVRDGTHVHVIPVGQIEHIDAQDDYVMIHAAGKKYIKLETLAELEGTLDPKRFVRIHRSHILNIEKLARLETYAKESRLAVLTGGTKLPVSRSGYEKLKEFL
ncbi:MAG TPA: LytTR family DNA-binding domain-containing protein [Bacteroidota bacterium]|nr:LytTR family DNA-binding domain-containing protein [Bacteroidota bacterium]